MKVSYFINKGVMNITSIMSYNYNMKTPIEHYFDKNEINSFF